MTCNVWKAIFNRFNAVRFLSPTGRPQKEPKLALENRTLERWFRVAEERPRALRKCKARAIIESSENLLKEPLALGLFTVLTCPHALGSRWKSSTLFRLKEPELRIGLS